MTAMWALQRARRCWCGRTVSWDGVFCAEHDDPPIVRCGTCSHGPTQHTGGHGKCWFLTCGCAEFVDAVDPDQLAASIARHPAGKALPQTPGDSA